MHIGLMKKILIAFLCFQLTACSLWTEEELSLPADSPQPIEQILVSNPINFDSELTEADIAYYTDNDDIFSLINSTPYYIGQQSLSVPAFAEFDELKQAKVQVAMTSTTLLYQELLKLNQQLDVFRIAFHQFVSVANAHESKVQEFARESAGQFFEFTIKEAVLLTRLISIEKESTDDPIGRSFLEYQKTQATLQLAKVLYEDLAFLYGNGAQLVAALEGSINPDIQAAVLAFNEQMATIEDLNETLMVVNQRSGEIDLVLRQIETADYQMGLASLAFIREQMPDLKKQVATLQPSTDLTDEDITFIDQYLAAFESFSDSLNTVMSQVDTADLISTAPETGTTFIPQAKADFTNTLSGAFDVLRQGAVKGAQATKLVWNGAKTAVGVSLDVLDAHSKTFFDIGFGLYGGEEVADIGTRVYANYQGVLTNIDRGASGSQVLKTAGQYLENVETGLDDFTADQVGQYAGKGWTSWLAGKTAKITAGMFTGLGKGIYKVANTQATTGEVVEGTIDIGFAFIGGSKVVIKGSQLLSGGKEGLTLLGRGGINFLKNTWNKASLANLKTLYAAAVKEGGEDAALFLAKYGEEITRREALVATLNTINQSIQKDLVQAIKTSARTVLENLKGAKGSYDEFVHKMYADDTLKNFIGGLKNAIDDAAGTTLKDYFDNLSGSVIDDLVKGAIKQFVEDTFGKFGGTYSGVLTIETITIPITLVVDGPGISGSLSTTIEFEIFDEPVKIIVTAQISGSINETAAVQGSLVGTASSEEDSVGFTGSFDGSVSETSMDLRNFYIIGPEDRGGPFMVTLTKY